MRQTEINTVQISDEEPLSHIENYGQYSQIAYGNDVLINTNSITKDTWQSHYDSVLNILRDGIETDEVQHCYITITFADNVTLDLSIMDYLINLIMWNMLIRTNTKIESKHVFFDDEIKQDTIKDYIDRFLIDENRKLFSNKELNNIIDDTLCHFHDIDEFAYFLSNTVNLEDNVFLMNACEDFNECMHADLSGVPIEDVKSVGMVYANRAMDHMKNAKQYLGYDHCLADAWRASEGISPKQFKEFTINIGTKPDGRGGVFEKPILNSFINGGVATPMDYFIESSTGRTAQIIKFKNVGSSGHFARLLGLNNMDSYLHHDVNYDCCTKNFVKIFVKDAKTLKMLRNRYYRLAPHGIEKLITRDSNDLIGKTIYLRSPITCASAARSQGICYKCYGDLAYTVYDAQVNFGVNIGRIASETLSSSLTQKLLSAKHLLETFVEKITWSDKFNDLFEIEGNMIRMNSEVEAKEFKMIIDPESIELVNEEDDDLSSSDDESAESAIFNEYLCEFEVFNNTTTESYNITSDKNTKLFITNELNKIIRKKGEPIDGKISIDFSEIKDITLFVIPIENNELSKTLEHLQDLLDKSATIKGMDIHTLLQNILETVIDGGLKIASTHLEVILSNQCRDADDILQRAKWNELNPRYEIVTLNRALTCNPSITVSMSYQKVGKLLYNPLTYRKNGSSFMDLFFMKSPQYAITNRDAPDDTYKVKEGELIRGMTFFGDPSKVTLPQFEQQEDDNNVE